MRLSSNHRAIAVALLGLALAACGGTNSQVPPGAASQPGSSAAPAASISSASTSAASSAAADQPYAGLAQSKTAEGYYVLGDADAPVTLTFYSDFI